MIGSVTERPSKAVTPIVVGSSGGFPAMRKVPIKGTRESRSSVAEAIPREAPAGSQEVIPRKEEPVMDENSIFIQKMSDAERREAMDEIHSLISPKNLAFLQKLPMNHFGDVDAAVPASNGVGNKRVGSEAPLVSSGQPRPSSRSEQVSSGPAESNTKVSSETGARTIADYDRYDLNGRRIVDLDAAFLLFSELANEPPLSLKGQAADEASKRAIAVVRSLSDPGGTEHPFILLQEQALVAAQNQPQDELRHHQFNSDVPGYSFVEISEMFRSQFGSQRIAAMRMIVGMLERRDCVAALPAYSAAFADKQVISGALAGMAAASVSEWGRVGRLMQGIGVAYHSAVVQVVAQLNSNTTLDHEECVNRAKKWLERCFLKVLCAADLPAQLPTLLIWALGAGPGGRLLRDSNDRDAAEDTALPASFGHSAPVNNPVVAKLALLQCVRAYLSSPAEECAASLLHERGVLWTPYGLPRLPTPHARRPDMCYEQFMHDCAERATSFLKEQEEDQEEEGEQERVAPSVMDVFALQSRWGRVEALCSRSNLVAQVTAYAHSAAEVMLTQTTSAAQSSRVAGSTCAEEKCLPTSIMPTLRLGSEALSLLLVLARQGSEGVVLQICKQVQSSAVWRYVRELLQQEHSHLNGALQLALLSQRCQWWSLFSQLACRSRRFVQQCWEGEAEWLLPLLLRRTGRAFEGRAAEERSEKSDLQMEEACLILAFVRTSIAYGYGLSWVTDLLLALQQGTGRSPISASSQTGGGQVNKFMHVLAESALTCSGVLSKERALRRREGSAYQLSGAAEEALQTASAILSLVRRELPALVNYLRAEESQSNLDRASAVLFLLCALFCSSEVLPSTGDSAGSAALVELKVCVRAAAAMACGDGLLKAVVGLCADLVAGQASQHGSVAAGTVHVSGQCVELLQASAALGMFVALSMLPLINQAGAAVAKCDAGSAEGVLAAEVLLLCQRFIGSAWGIADGGHQQSCLEVAELCARYLTAPLITSGDVVHRIGSSVKASGAVSQGLFMWHWQRVQHASFFAQAALLATIPDGTESESGRLVRYVYHHLGSHSSHLLVPAVASLLRGYVRFMVSTAVRCSANCENNSGLAHHDHLSEVHQQLIATVCESALGVHARAADLPSMLTGGSSAGSWLAMPSGREGTAARTLHLRPTWAYDVLAGSVLRGQLLSLWMEVLLAQWGSSTPAAVKDKEWEVLAEQVYALLKLTVTDQADRWVSDGADAGDCVSDSLAGTYTALLCKVVGVAAAGSAALFRDAFCAVTARDFAQGAGALAALRRAGRPLQQQRSSVDGALDLCEKALDAGLNQLVHPEVHAAALLVLSSPCMPWAVRHKVWLQLEQAGLLHLLESPSTVADLLPVLLSEGGDSVTLYTVMVDVLSQLRSAEDRRYSIVAVAVFQLARYLFHGVSYPADKQEAFLPNAAVQLLTHLGQLNRADADRVGWLLQALLYVGARIVEGTLSISGTALLEEVGQCIVRNVNEGGNSKDLRVPASLSRIRIPARGQGGMLSLGDVLN